MSDFLHHLSLYAEGDADVDIEAYEDLYLAY